MSTLTTSRSRHVPSVLVALLVTALAAVTVAPAPGGPQRAVAQQPPPAAQSAESYLPMSGDFAGRALA